MFKLIFIAVIVLSSAGIGNVIVGDWAARKNTIAVLQNAIKTLKSALVYQSMPLYEALLQAGKTAFGSFFSQCVYLLRQNPQIEGRALCFEAAAACKDSFASLKAPEQEALADLFGRLSVAISAEQVEDACAMFLRQTDLIAGELRAQQEQKGRLTKTLCIVAGLVVSILLV